MPGKIQRGLAPRVVVPDDRSLFREINLRVIYQFFSTTDTVVSRRLDFPILFSIATLRAQHPDCEVFVLEYPAGRLDWQDFPERLRFRVVRPPCEPASHDGLIPVLMARPAHVWERAEGMTCYCDSDILWLDRIRSFDLDYVHINRSNAGFYLFDPTAYRAAAFMGLWADRCAEAIRDQGLRDAMRAAHPEPYLHDESVYRQLRASHPEWLARWLWYLTKDDLAHPWDLPRPGARLVHLVMARCGVRRGSLAWLLRESKPALKLFFSDLELRDILGHDYDLGGMFSLRTLDDAVRRINP